ncbi:MAG: hypothetical protein OEU40_10315 [Gammaproteobacteria bacterium]|nr:hypothetical protein [Gammaproteobacteria bacterium]
MKNLLSIFMLGVLSGSISFVDSIPEGYAGDRATITDSFANHAGPTAHFFVLSKISGQAVEDSGYRTEVDNYGRGRNMTPVMVSREVTTQEQSFTIKGFVQFASIAESFGKDDMLVEGVTQFTPSANQVYTVRGSLGTAKSKVWIEDSSGEVVGEPVSTE